MDVLHGKPPYGFVTIARRAPRERYSRNDGKWGRRGGEERRKEGRSGLPDFLPAALPASHVPVPSFAAYLEQIIRAAFRRDL